jgi:acyl-CoA synthetase (AMP-forming)/AMP-acid ligase II
MAQPHDYSGPTDAPWQTIPELIDDSCARFPDLEALVDDDVRLTFAQLGDRLNESARAHMASGMAKGDRFAVWAPNIWEWPIAALGGHKAGAVVIPINTRFKGREAAYVLRKSKARILFTVTDFLDTDYVELLRATDEELPDLEQIVVLRGPVPEGCISFADFLARGSEVDDADRVARSAGVTGDDLCHILFTSGTTGAPKGAMLVHKAICKAYLAWADVVGLRAGDRYLVINPFFHAFGLNAGILVCLMKGACIVPQLVFDVPAVMKRVPEERISVLPGPPAIYQTILNHPDLDAFDMSTLRLAVTGAAAVPVEMILQMRQRLSFETIVTGYGLTETSGIATMCRHDDDPETIAHTSGRAIPDVEVLVVDPEGNEVPRGEPGEIVVRGYNVMKGYLDDPEQTAEAIDPDGWLHTGDIGTMDERGYIDITDRVKDMFINGGFNAYPAEIEDLMLRHPHIGRVAVVGVPDERMGEVGMAFVIPRPGTAPDPDEIVSWARGEMANYKAPRHVVIVDDLPMNAGGKVLKYELRERGKQLVKG